jgi:hypothetical protein
MPRLFVWAKPSRFSWDLKKETGGRERPCACVYGGDGMSRRHTELPKRRGEERPGTGLFGPMRWCLGRVYIFYEAIAVAVGSRQVSIGFKADGKTSS